MKIRRCTHTDQLVCEACASSAASTLADLDLLYPLISQTEQQALSGQLKFCSSRAECVNAFNSRHSIALGAVLTEGPWASSLYKETCRYIDELLVQLADPVPEVLEDVVASAMLGVLLIGDESLWGLTTWTFLCEECNESETMDMWDAVDVGTPVCRSCDETCGRTVGPQLDKFLQLCYGIVHTNTEQLGFHLLAAQFILQQPVIYSEMAASIVAQRERQKSPL